MTYEVVLHDEADAEIELAATKYESERVGLGFEFLTSVDAAVAGLGRQPLIYQVLYAGVRRVLLRRFPYSLFYVVIGDTVEILICHHHKMSPRRVARRVAKFRRHRVAPR